MKPHIRIFVVFGLTLGILVPVALAQKPAPLPPRSNPAPTSPSQPANPTSATSPAGQPETDFVMFLSGKVATDDGSNLPTNVMVERVCNSRVRQQVYADPSGGFNMQLGSVTDSTLDATAEGSSQAAQPGKFAETGIPRQQLENCDLRASASGFQSRDISLVALDPSGKNVEIGTIVVHRRTKVAGTTVDAAAYKAPKDAVTAYEKGLDAENSGKLANAQKYFQRAVDVYPDYARAWFRLGTVLERENQKVAARAAYTHATTADVGYLPPYLSLAAMACARGNWREVIHDTNFILALDPFKDLTGYTIELDAFSYAEAYFYNALANYQVENFGEAERNALKSEHMLARKPELHLLLAQIFARKNDYRAAVAELQTYLDLSPHAVDAEQVGAQLAEWKKLSDSPSTGEKNDPK